MFVGEILDVFPREVWVLSAEVATRSQLSINRPIEFQVTNNDSWSQIEVSHDYVSQVVVNET